MLSKRLQAVLNLVGPCETAADIGCDHGYLAIELIRKGIAKHVLATDINAGPLERAKEHILSAGLQDRIETIRCDGMQGIYADTVILAGMGGRLMHKILTDAPKERSHTREFVLQPQSDLAWFREQLCSLGLAIIAEDFVIEDEKYYPMMKVRKGSMQLTQTEALYGPLLLKEKNELLESYLRQQSAYLQELAESLQKQDSIKSRERLLTLEEERRLNREALDLMKER